MAKLFSRNSEILSQSPDQHVFPPVIRRTDQLKGLCMWVLSITFLVILTYSIAQSLAAQIVLVIFGFLVGRNLLKGIVWFINHYEEELGCPNQKWKIWLPVKTISTIIVIMAGFISFFLLIISLIRILFSALTNMMTVVI